MNKKTTFFEEVAAEHVEIAVVIKDNLLKK